MRIIDKSPPPARQAGPLPRKQARTTYFSRPVYSGGEEPPSSAVGGGRRLPLWTLIAIFALPALAHAEETMTHDHGGGIYRAIRLEIDQTRKSGADTTGWDAHGWVGGDVNRLWLKSEGTVKDGKLTEGEVWAMAGHQISTFWDAQFGLRQDLEPQNHTYLVAGITGLTPYFFETEAHIFVREDGALSAWVKQENDLLLTNRLILQPSLELRLNARADDQLHLGTGLTSVKAGLQLRYEIRRGFAPYLRLEHDEHTGDTADRLKAAGETAAKTRVKAGLRLLF
jgi:copper resistance protein B